MSDPTPASDAGTDALQVALAAEHAAVFVYGALGGQTSQSGSPALYAAVTAAYDAHLARRDALVAALRAAGVEPAAAEPGYELPSRLDSPAAVRARALRLEQDGAATYAFVVASTSGADRARATEALLDAAVRSLSFGGRPEQLPGL